MRPSWRLPRLREIGKQEIESPTKAADNMPLPLAQNMGKIIGRSSKQFRTELVKGLGNTHGFEMHIMARKEPNGNWLVRVLHHNVIFYYDMPEFQNQLGVMAFLEAHE